MSISRKEFFIKSLYSLGEACSTVSKALNDHEADDYPCQPEGEFVPFDRDDVAAVAHNEHCLARNCGCFACVERCEPQAIMVVMGEGIRIDPSRCTGCGTCEYVCPVSPKAVTLAPRQLADGKSGSEAKNIYRKENELC